MKPSINFLITFGIYYSGAATSPYLDHRGRPAGVKPMLKYLDDLPDRSGSDDTLKKSSLQFLRDEPFSDDYYELAYQKGYRILYHKFLSGMCYEIKLSKDNFHRVLEINTEEVDASLCGKYYTLRGGKLSTSKCCEGKGPAEYTSVGRPLLKKLVNDEGGGVLIRITGEGDVDAIRRDKEFYRKKIAYKSKGQFCVIYHRQVTCKDPKDSRRIRNVICEV